MLGRWDEAGARLADIPDEQIGTDSSLVSPPTSVLEIHLHRGRLDEARRLLGRYEELGRSGDVQVEGSYHAGLAAVRLAEGDYRAALAAAEHAFATREHVGIAGQGPKMGFLHAAESARAQGDDPKLNELLEIVEALPPGLRPPFLAASAQRFRAHVAAGEPAADRHFSAAAAEFRRLELPFYLAVVQFEHGEWLTAQGRPDDAQPLFTEARDTFERLEAKPWLERLTAASASTAAKTIA
jgi:ATP/maltotriose-dependent transcriptional regulator MalT